MSYPNYAIPSAALLVPGFDAIGLKELPGMEDGNLLGWTWIANTIDPTTQVRSTSETAFLREALQVNDNLLVYQNTLAKKLIFDANGTATGVIVDNPGVGSGSVTYNISADKEVILSCGSFRSPQLLMVSGIGPADTLRANGIDVLVDRPGVGQNMWDHIFFGPAYDIDTVTHAFLADPGFAAQAAQEYNTYRIGMLTNVGGDLLGK